MPGNEGNATFLVKKLRFKRGMVLLRVQQKNLNFSVQKIILMIFMQYYFIDVPEICVIIDNPAYIRFLII